MSFSVRFVARMAMFLGLAGNACAARDARPVALPPTVACAGGAVRSAADAMLYSACDIVHGDLQVSAPELTDLRALRRLQTVEGKLEIHGNPRLESLGGLERLERVGSLSLRDNAELEDVSALSRLRAAASIVISDAPLLGSLRGLDHVGQVDRLVIERTGIYQASGLGGLTRVGQLIVRDNARLNSLHGLRSLVKADKVVIQRNPRLCALGMLPALQRVERSVTLVNNRGLSKRDVRSLLDRMQPRANPAAAEPTQLEASLR